MNIFEKRTLSLILCVMLGGFSLFSFLDATLKVVLVSGSIIIAILSFSLPIFEHRTLLKISTIFLFISCLFSYVYFQFIFYLPENNVDKSKIHGVVSSISPHEHYNEIIVESATLNNNAFPTYKILVKDYSKTENLTAGDTISLNSKLNNFSNSEDFDYKTFYASKGISGYTNNQETITKISIGNPPISHYFSELRNEITTNSISILGNDEGGFFSALLMGDKSYMDYSLNASFKRIGISHILAVSGMHLTILCGAISFLLSLFNVNKRYRVLTSALFCIFFMFLCGMPPSILRAGVMYLIASFLYLIVGCRDGITNLFVAMTLILIAQPYAVFDIGLWLSAAATFGILVGSEIFEERYIEEGFTTKLIKGIGLSLYYSIFAIAATIAISSISFGTLSFMSAPATLIFGFLTEIYIYVGLITVFVIPSAQPFISALYKLIHESSVFFASQPYVYTSAEFPTVLILTILFTVLLIMFAIIKIKYKKLYIGGCIVLLVFIYSLSINLTIEQKYDDSVIYNADEGDRFLLNSNGVTSLVDFSDYYSSDMRKTVNFANDNYVCEVNNYIILNYSYNLCDSIDLIIQELAPDIIHLPLPKSYEEDYIATTIYKISSDFGTYIDFYESADEINLGNYDFIPIDRAWEADSFTACAALFRFEGELYGYMSQGALSSFGNAEALLYLTKGLVFGNYGTKYKNTITIAEIAPKLKTIIISNSQIEFSDRIDLSDVNFIEYSKSTYLIEKKK